MKEWIKDHAFVLVCVTVVTIGIILVVTTFVRGSDAPPSTSTTAVTPNDEHSSDEVAHNHEDDVHDANPADCANSLAPEELVSFVESVKNYEEVFQSPPSLSRVEKLTALTTAEYQASHETTGAETASDAIVELLRDKTTVACTVKSDGTRLASSLVVLRTSFLNKSGEVEVIYPELKIPVVHYSTWVVDNGVWKVTAEE